MIVTKIELRGLDEALKQTDLLIVAKAGRRTIQRAAASGKTLISSQIREQFKIKKSDLDKKIAVDLRGLNDLRATLTVYGDPISLMYFNPQQYGVRMMTKYGSIRAGNIRTKISKDKGLMQTRMKNVSQFAGVKARIVGNKDARLHAFIAKGKGGVFQVFRRIGKKRKPIQAVKVISYTTILKKPSNIQAVEMKIIEQLNKEWATNLAYYRGTLR